MIRERRLDVGFVVLPIADPGLKFRLLVREPLVAVLPENHPMAGMPKSFIEGAGQGKLRFLPAVFRPPTRFHELVFDICRSRGFDPHIAHESSSGAATMSQRRKGSLSVRQLLGKAERSLLSTRSIRVGEIAP
jgi:DNA-binding transcriptional LysR family regulator